MFATCPVGHGFDSGRYSIVKERFAASCFLPLCVSTENVRNKSGVCKKTGQKNKKILNNY
jgi:hypothetical protein